MCNRRLRAVQVFTENNHWASDIIEMLKVCEDVERIMQKVCMAQKCGYAVFKAHLLQLSYRLPQRTATLLTCRPLRRHCTQLVSRILP